MKELAPILALVIGCGSTSSSEQRSPAPVVAFAPAADDAKPRDPPALIANTDLPDTSANRAVIDFCERYRHAVEQRDIDTLLSLASPNYLEDGGTPDRADDIDYRELENYLRAEFRGADPIRYEIRYRSVSEQGGTIRVDVSYSASYRILGEVQRRVGENQLVLERHAGSFRFLSGM